MASLMRELYLASIPGVAAMLTRCKQNYNFRIFVLISCLRQISLTIVRLVLILVARKVNILIPRRY